MKHFIRYAIAVFSLHAAAADKPSEWQPLLDASLSKFDVYLSYRGDQIMNVLKGTAPADLKPAGLNPPGQDVVSVIEQGGKPVLRITGEYYGCVVTKQDFSNYRFRAQFKLVPLFQLEDARYGRVQAPCAQTTNGGQIHIAVGA